MKTLVLLAHQFVDLSLDPNAGSQVRRARGVDSSSALGTVLANLAYFGYAPSLEVLAQWRGWSAEQLCVWWETREPHFRSVTGADRQMDRFVVYKNFPKEVLGMSQAQYWTAQLFMYLGAPNEWFTQEEQTRPALDERLRLKTLALAQADTLQSLYDSLVGSKARWTEPQAAYALFLAKDLGVRALDLADFGFKENGVTLMARLFDAQLALQVHDATDVARLAAALSGQDVSLRTAVRFRRFARPQRRQLLALLEQCRNLEADFAMRESLWKQLLRGLRPGDYAFKRVQSAYDLLYRGCLETFSASIESGLFHKDARVVERAASRPGDFVRRLHKLYALFPAQTVAALDKVVDKLQVMQLLKLRNYLVSVRGRAYFLHAPKGNWSKARLAANTKATLEPADLSAMLASIDRVLEARLRTQLPQGVDLDLATDEVKLQANDQELAPYGRGTAFPLPASARFVRTASYWATQRTGNVWFDNSFNFFDEQWHSVGTCCWNVTNDFGAGAVFSGDPTNSKDMQGRACQMIDLNLDELARRGVRYAVWSVLGFSHMCFSDADDVLATLQWGEDPCAGKLYEPARAQMVFPLKGKSLTKYVAYVDVVEKRLVYLDANLRGAVNSAASNGAHLSTVMPAFMEYLKALPSVADLMVHAPQGSVPVRYSDAEAAVDEGQLAYVFRPVNPASQFKPLSLERLLG